MSGAGRLTPPEELYEQETVPCFVDVRMKKEFCIVIESNGETLHQISPAEWKFQQWFRESKI